MSIGKVMLCALGLIGAACGGVSSSDGTAGTGNGTSGGTSNAADEPITTTKVLGLRQLAASEGTIVAIADAETVTYAGDQYRDSKFEKAVIYSSVEGAAFSEVLSDPAVHLDAVAAGNGHFAVLGKRPATPNGQAVLYVSEDAQMWMEVALPNPAVHRLVFGNGTFVASDYVDGGHVYVSNDARTWELSSNQVFKALSFGAGRFVGTSGDGFAVSEDGRAWTHIDYDAYELLAIENVAAVGDVFVATTSHMCCWGEKGTYYHLVTSVDGLTWTPQAFGEGLQAFPVWSPVGCVGVTFSTSSLNVASGASCASTDYSLSSAGSMLWVDDRAYAIHTDKHSVTSIVTSTDALNWNTLME